MKRPLFPACEHAHARAHTHTHTLTLIHTHAHTHAPFIQLMAPTPDCTLESPEKITNTTVPEIWIQMESSVTFFQLSPNGFNCSQG